jgi:hypothetical protein
MSKKYFSSQGRVVAVLQGHVLRKRVIGSMHMLRQPPAWAIDSQILEQAQRDGAREVEITDTETGRIYRTAIDTFNAHGFRFNRGFGDQVGLALYRWHVEALGVEQLELFQR